MFWISLILLAALIWAAVPFVFRPLGRFITDILNDIKKTFEEED